MSIKIYLRNQSSLLRLYTPTHPKNQLSSIVRQIGRQYGALPPLYSKTRNLSLLKLNPFPASSGRKWFRTAPFSSSNSFPLIASSIPNNRPSSSLLLHIALAASVVSLASISFQTAYADEKLSSEQLQPLIDILQISPSEVEDYQGDLHTLCLTAAYQACRKGEWNKIDQIKPEILSILKDKNGRTLLTQAIENGEEKIASHLLKRKICLNQKDKKGNTPLHLAAKVGYASLNRLLLRYFDLETRNSHGETPLHIAILFGREEALGSFLDRANLDQQVKEGGNLLHWAVSCGQFRMIDYLLAKYYKKISPLMEVRDSEGRTPLTLAAYLGEVAAIRILAKHKANIEATDLQGRRPIHWACQGLQREVVDCLADLGAELDPLDENMQRPEDLLQSRQDPANLHLYLIQAKEFQKKETRERSKLLRSPPRNLVFQGGGPKGIAYLAALEELEKRKVLGSLERVAGTSAGAITAGLMAVGYTSEDLKRELEAQDLTTFLDYSPTLEKELLEDSSILSQIRSKAASTRDSLKGIYKRLRGGGVCEGQAFLNWIEKRIEEATGIPHCTFGELAKLVQEGKPFPNGQKAKHLHLFATQIGDNPHPIHLSSEDPEWEDVIISDAIRMSMSIPIAYKPHTIHKKSSQGKIYDCPELGYFIDGGLLQNFPIQIFDQKRYKPHLVAEENPEELWYNPYTWGFSLYHPHQPQTISPHPSFFMVGKACASLLWNAEMLIKEVKDDLRVIRINNQGVGLLEFDLAEEKKQRLIDGSRKTTQSFLREYNRGKLGKTSEFYDEGLFRIKEAEEKLFLSPPHPDFLGRQQELKHLHQLFFRTKTWRDRAIVIPIVGPSGYGKSELAVAFASQHLEEFSYIWRIDLRNQETFERSYRELAKALRIPLLQHDLPIESFSGEINQRLEVQDDPWPWLLIFDNADEEIPVSFPQKGGCVLITSQSRERYARYNSLELGPLSPKDAEKLIEEITAENEKEIKKLAQDLNYIPVLLNQAAYYIAHTPSFRASDYRSLLQEKLSYSPTKEDLKLPMACWEIASSYLKERLPETAEWLTLCSHLSNRGIPKEWIAQWLAKREGEAISLKYYKKQTDILDLLSKYGLIYSSPYDKTFSLHGLLQRVILEGKDLQRTSLLESFVPFFTQLSEIKDFNPTHPLALNPFKKALPHAISLLDHLKEKNTLSHLKIQLLLSMIRYFIEVENNFTQAEKYLKEIEQYTPSDQHPIKGRILFFYGRLNSKKARQNPEKEKELHANALAYFKEARATFSGCLNPDEYVGLEQNPAKCNPGYQKAISLEYQAQTYLDLGKLDKADEVLDQAMEEFKELYPGGEHFDIARILREKGRILAKRKDFEGAVKKIEDALQMQRRVYKNFDSHSTVGATYTTLGDVYSDIGTDEALKKAESCYHEAIKINKRAYRTRYHHYNARIYRKRAGIADRLGDTVLAERMREHAIEIEKHIKEQNA